MPSDSNADVIHSLAIQDMLNLPKCYGPNGIGNVVFSRTGGPPADLVAVLEQLETATVDPSLLADGQTTASVEAQTVFDLTRVAGSINVLLLGAGSADSIGLNVQLFGVKTEYPSLLGSLQADAKLFTPAAAKPPVTVVEPPPASGVEQYLVTNVTTGVSDWQDGQAYNGPVATVQNQFVTVTTDNVNITATKPNNFIHTGSGNDAIDLSLFGGAGGGTNVADGGAGSNFVVLSAFGNSVDTVFIDSRAATADTWSTVRNFQEGDAATIYGVTPSATTLDWEDDQGAAGFKGLTLHVIEQGKPIASLTLPGYGKADLGNGRLGVSFGNDSTNGGSYLHIQGTAA